VKTGGNGKKSREKLFLVDKRVEICRKKGIIEI